MAPSNHGNRRERENLSPSPKQALGRLTSCVLQSGVDLILPSDQDEHLALR